jgi:hypothetical protein
MLMLEKLSRWMGCRLGDAKLLRLDLEGDSLAPLLRKYLLFLVPSIRDLKKVSLN